jgi:hypothetical protein
LEELEADQAAGDPEESLVDVGTAFVADAQTAVLMEPRDRALDDPALCAKTGAVWLLRARDGGADPAGTQLAAVVAGVVGAVAE